ncbi:hypothetical protein PIB30_104412 [Stylosanthes scabra]|uniref:Uncharacterized protein n=1 Tax=Stylosanthes scabra TaxID=79078 RepID=A0ABU6ZWV9_9FABA|nr:hypothetical protein [Stylosanthes scabra]
MKAEEIDCEQQINSINNRIEEAMRCDKEILGSKERPAMYQANGKEGTTFLQQSENGDMYIVELAEEPQTNEEEALKMAIEVQKPSFWELELVESVNRSLNFKQSRDELDIFPTSSTMLCLSNNVTLEDNLGKGVKKRKTDPNIPMAEETGLIMPHPQP